MDSVAELGGPRRDVATPSADAPRSSADPAVFAEAVLAVVDLVPAAHVLTYGDVAELLDRGGPRQVGRVLSRSTRDVPWWRILRAGGRPAQGLAARARVHYDAEGTALIAGIDVDDPSDYRVDLVRARWSPTDEEHEAIARLADVLRR